MTTDDYVHQMFIVGSLSVGPSHQNVSSRMQSSCALPSAKTGIRAYMEIVSFLVHKFYKNSYFSISFHAFMDLL